MTGVITQGSGNAVTSGTLDGNTLVLNKDLTFATDQSNTNSFWELREDLNGKSYLYANYDIATLGGHAMYVDGDDTLSLPGLYDGIPIDNITIYWDTDENGNKILKSVGTGSGGGGVADKIAWANVYGKPSWITNDKPVYDYSEIQNVPDLSGFVTIEGYQEVKGVKNFLNGIQIADLPITKLNGYADVIYIDANVVVRGGLTMYSTGEADIPSLTDSIVTDGITILNDNGVLKINPDIQLGGITEEEMQAIVNLINTKWTTDNTKISHWDTAYSWGNHANAGYVTKQYVDDTFVTFKKDEIITGLKTFTKGIQIGSPQMPIKISQLQDDILYIDSNVIIRGGLTMYYDNGEIDLPSIKEEIGNAGYDGTTGLASFNSEHFSISLDGIVSIIGGTGGLDIEQLELYLTSNKYVQQSYVDNAVSNINNILNDFLTGTDTDTIINKWKELEAFLSGLSESDNLATILSTKWTTDNSLINKWNTAYGWGNHASVGYALKSYVDDTFVTIKGNEDVTGIHDFVNGLRIGNIKLSKSQEGVLYLEGNLVVKGGVTMYALDEVTVDSIIDSLPLASTSQYGIAKFNPSNFFINKDGFVTIIGGSGGLDTEELAEYLATNKYATQGWVEGKGYITSSALSGYATQSWVTNQKYITGITSAMVVSALGFTPYNSANFTKANIKSTLGISDWALASSKPSYTTSEVTEGSRLYFTNQRAIDALASTLADYVTLGTKQTITGEKNFMGGLKVNGSPIYYDATNKYWKLEGDLLVTGGVTMYGTDEGDLPSILDSLPIASTSSLGVAMFDSTYFKVASSGKVTLLPDNVGLNESSLNSYLTTNKYLTQTKADDRYLSIEGGTLNGTVKVPQLTVYMDTDSSRVRGLAWSNTSGNRIASLRYWNTEKKFILNPVGSSDDYVDAVGKYNLVIGENTLTYNTYAILHSNNFTDKITKRNVVINGSKWTVFSSVTTDTTGIYAPTTIGTANQVLMSSGSGAPTWANQSALSVGNATSATKLQTARTIWGQSFNGTANIDGAFYMNNNTYMYFKNASGSNMIGMYASTSGNLIIGAGVASIGNSTYIDGKTVRLRYGTNSALGFILNDAGNVGFGTDSPNYKVHAIGTGYFSNGINYSTAATSFNSLGIKFDTDLARISVSSAGNMGIYATGVVSIRGNSKSESSGTGLTIDGGGNASLTGKLTLTGTDSTTALLEFLRDGYNYITFPNTLSIGTSTAAADRQLVINSASATFQCNILPSTTYTYSLGTYGNAFKNSCINAVYSGSASYNLWLVGGNSSDNYGVVIGRNSTNTTSGAEICRFNANGLVWASGVYGDIRTTDTSIYLRRAGLNTNTVFLGNGYFSPYSDSTDLLQLGRPTARWKGVFVGIGTPASNGYGLQFCDTSNNYVGRISHSTNMGIYSSGDIYIRGGCTKGTSNLTASSTGLCVYASGDILVTGGITMYSDTRKKTILNQVELSLQQIANAPLIEHYYNSDQNKTTHVGSIAQYWYGMNDWFCKKDSEGFLTMEIQNCALASAISIARHLEKYESKTDKKIRMLKKRVQKLEDKLERLEGGKYGCR